MTEKTNADKEFQQQALFDLDFKKGLERTANDEYRYADDAGKSVSSYEKDINAQTKGLNQERLLGSAIRGVEIAMEGCSPELRSQVTTYLDNLINKSHYTLKSERDEQSKPIDVDGSKKSLWGKLKNKAKNFLKPFNKKLQIEDAIGRLRDDMIKNPDYYEGLKGEFGHASFKEISEKHKSTMNMYADRRVDSAIRKNEASHVMEDSLNNANKAQAKVDAINQVRDNAAKEIELKNMARETTGIKDINANTGIDKLAEKAKEMEGLTPAQRLAKRMEMLRGTGKQEQKATVKREIDTQTLNKIMSDKTKNI